MDLGKSQLAALAVGAGLGAVGCLLWNNRSTSCGRNTGVPENRREDASPEIESTKDLNQHWFRGSTDPTVKDPEPDRPWFQGETPTKDEALDELKRERAAVAWFTGKAQHFKGSHKSPPWFKQGQEQTPGSNATDDKSGPEESQGEQQREDTDCTTEEVVNQLAESKAQLAWFRGETRIAWASERPHLPAWDVLVNLERDRIKRLQKKARDRQKLQHAKENPF